MKTLNPQGNPSIILILGLLLGCLNTYAATDCTAVTEISQIECESLLQLYHSTAGANWKNNEGWNVTNTPCSWHGITCENNSVMAIRLAGTSPSPYSSGYCSRSYYSKNLVGTIPNFKSLPNLQILSLSINKLTGEIPDFSGLPNLQNLSLSNNQLTGEIPNFSGLPNLQRLSLENNQLTGEIPNFNDLPNLIHVSIRGNQLTNITDCNVVTQISQIECESLLQLYHSTDGPNWKNNEGWNVTNTPCSWHGISCENNSVVAIKLEGISPGPTSSSGALCSDYYDHNLVGIIPNFKSLPNLQSLSLSKNKLTGEIPDFSGLPNLQSLSLSNNKLTGEIPDFSGLPNLQGLSLSNNKLTGEIPDFSDLHNLQKLELRANQLTGEIPNFSSLPNLQTLYLWDNQLTGKIPDFNGLSNLQTLSLSNNQLTGAIPDFSGLPNLQRLFLSNNQLMGVIPNFNDLPNLREFDYTGNQLTGTTDCSAVKVISQVECESLLQLYNSTNGLHWNNNKGWNVTNIPCNWYGITCENNGVVKIYLHGNILNGNIPNFSSLPNLQTLSLSNNQLIGEIPNFSGLPNLQTLSLSSNQLIGEIPNFSGLPNLQILNLSSNQLIGEIPNFSGLPNLQVLNLGNYSPWGGNQLTGEIPNFNGLPNLQTLYLSYNQLTGAVPDFSSLPNLQTLNLKGNQLTGTSDCRAVTEISQMECESLLQLYHSTNGPNWIHNDNWNLTNMPCNWYGITCENNGVVTIYLNRNGLNGNIPNFSGLPNLQTLSLSNNPLTGTLSDFSGLSNLQGFSLYNNQLMGEIPDFSGLPNLQKLSLSSNQLTGNIPNFSGLPNLYRLSLDDNQLTGEIPDFSELPNLQTLSLEANQLTTVQIILEKENYRPSEHFKAELTETFSEGYDLYAAVLLPNGTDFMALENTNQFVPLNQPQKWSANEPVTPWDLTLGQNERVTLLDFTLPADLATGEYCLYGILSPENESVLEVAEQWVMDSQCVEINTTN